MRGRKPKPSYLRVLDGQANDKPLNPDEPQPSGDLDAPPAWMSEAQRESWRYAIEHAPPGLLKRLDKSVLAVWVVAEALHAEAAQKVAQYGAVVKSRHLWVQSPYMGIQNKQALIMMRAASEMGFSPTSRTRVRLERDRGSNPFDDLKSLDDE
jgi:P27 family predicted phage terminase small subunit